ncbi:hypothetical protein LWE61_05725 [Sphingobium sufflavum]|uniref:hypothetical protein n=1 Tax=Sphingobium sufflavum TaxID=1129547 RepID=UPI001F46D2E0|nr:hypothetical protein [Sphingobium sufflavum]MCE7796059.1 hypothetical protein [Sphingobium sufflavum]
MTSPIFKLVLAAAAIAVSVPALAKTEETSFQRDGYTYVYSVTEKGSTKHIRGKYYPGGRSFALEVRNGRVEGTVAESGVSFPLSAIARPTGDALASAD